MKLLISKLPKALYRYLKSIAGNFKNLQVLIILAMSVVSLFAMGVFTLSIFQKIQDIVTDNAITNSQQVVKQSGVTLNNYIDNMSEIFQSISDGIQDSDFSSGELGDFLDASQVTGIDVVSIALFGGGAVPYYAPSDRSLKQGISLDTQQWYSETSDDQPFSISTPHMQNLFDGQYTWVITLSTKIELNGYEYIMAIDMDFGTINDYCKQINIGSRGYVFLVDMDGKIVYHPQQQMVYAGIKEEDVGYIIAHDDGAYLYDDEIVMVIYSLKYTDWKAVGVSYLQDTQETTSEIIGYMLTAFLFALTLIVVFSITIARYISRPIGRIINTMETAQDNQFTDFVHEEGYDEAQRLSTAYNNMTLRIQELMNQITREQRELRKTEIRALHAQINPHFLYNTLDSILWMCEKGDNQSAVLMISSLSTLFRISLNRGREIVTIRQELDHAENYLLIQSVRYKDQFTYEIEISENLLERKVPKILLQPFLENAIYHGFGQGADKGLIKIRVAERDDKLLIEIKDNGVGMPRELVEKLNLGAIFNESGIGISNVNGRIQIYFGKEYGVRVHSVPDQGTCIEIWLPANITEDDMLE